MYTVKWKFALLLSSRVCKNSLLIRLYRVESGNYASWIRHNYDGPNGIGTKLFRGHHTATHESAAMRGK